MASCSCNQAQPFEIIVNNEKQVVYGLDVIVFQTTMNKPQTRVEAENLLWQYAQVYNDIPSGEGSFLREALYESYLKMKHVLERYL